MALSEEKVREYMKRLLVARMRILCNHGFYGLLLMNMIYSVDEGAPTAYTDGERIAFGIEFLENLSDSELDYVLMHEILHVVLHHCLRGKEMNSERYNIAADIVINSIIMAENGGNPSSITLSDYGVSMHVAPDGKEGNVYTAEEVYEMLPSFANYPSVSIKLAGGSEDTRAKKKAIKPRDGSSTAKRWDDHSNWGKFEEDSTLRDVWVKNFAEACEAIKVRDSSSGRGTLPMFAKRLLEKLTKPQTDWRQVLNEFLSEETLDYSFSPPDRRFYDSPFFLPDLNEPVESEADEIKKVLFMVDTSGSISDKAMTAAYSEIKGAIDQFAGKVEGWLGFFDAAIIEPKPFSSLEEFLVIKPAGGGGTDFQIIFEYVARYMETDPPKYIVILTDGQAPYPKEELADNIPVLWLINNDDVTPPWGKIARIHL